MKSFHSWLFLLLFALLPSAASAQMEYSTWYFGMKVGLDFRSGSARVISDGPDATAEGIATICDPRTGELLFHTDGDSVWNRDRTLMPNGIGLGAHPSSTQAALIVPIPEDPDRFYIISTDGAEYIYGSSSAFIAIVDMRLDGGRGDVTQKKVVLTDSLAEKVAAVKHCNGRGYWVLFHELRSDRFLIYYLSKNGFEGPREVPIGSHHSRSLEAGIGGMKFSPSGDRLAVAMFTNKAVDLFDFDRKTGTLSNPMTIPVGEFTYDVCFSPDGSKLYVTGEQAKYLRQYDLSLGSPGAILASETVLFRSNFGSYALENTGQMQIGPDGRIYVAIRNELELSVITNPNLAGAACGYRHRVMPFGSRWRYATLGLPNQIYGVYDTTMETCRPPRARFTPSSLELCEGESVSFEDNSYDNPVTWQWSFPGGEPSSSSSRTPGRVAYSTPGSHRAMLVCGNANGTDTFFVDITVNPLPRIDAGADQRICVGESVAIRPSVTNGARFAWTPAAGLSCTDCPEPIASPTVTTTYTVTTTSERGCVSSDEVTVVVEEFVEVDAGRDTSVCVGESVQLRGKGGRFVAWSPDEGLSCTDCLDPIASPARTTIYVLTTSDNGRCVSIDSVRIAVTPRPQVSATDDVRICAGDSVVIGAQGGSRFSWTPAATLSCSDCATPTARPLATTTYYVEVSNGSGCVVLDSTTVFVDAAPRQVHAGLGPDIGVYPGSDLELPIMVDEPLDEAAIAYFDASIEYDPTIMYLDRATLDSTLTEGWTLVVTAEDRVRGRFAARFFAADGSTLTGSGALARLRFQSFINRGDSSVARLTLSFPGEECMRVLTRPVVVRLDSICGLSQRLVDVSASGYALEQNAPNPFNPTTTIGFSLGLDGPTRIEVIDAAGRPVETLVDATLASGTYSIVWDATAQPSGLYYCRITSGAWTRTLPMTLTK
jgi:PKD repeat protein